MSTFTGKESRMSRRGFLAGACRLGALATIPLLAACQPRGDSATPGPAARSAPESGVSAPATATASQPATAATRAVPGTAMLVGSRTVGVQLWPGPFAQLIRDLVQPSFEQDHGVKLAIQEGSPADQVTRLRTERSEPQHIVMGLDDLAVSMARQEGLISRLDPAQVPNLADVHPAYILEDGFGVAAGVNWVTVWYNSQKLKSAPTSYEAFWDPSLKGRVAVPSIAVTTGLQWLVVAAALAGGKAPRDAQFDVEPGFDRWKQLKPNLHSTYDNFSASARLLAQGEIWLSFGHSRQADHFVMKGAPVERAPVREGEFLGSNALVLVKHPSLEPLGRDLINRLLDPTLQIELARTSYLGPSNARAQVPPDLVRLVPSGADEAGRMVVLDWSHVNRHRGAWVERWNWEVGG